MSFLTHNKQCQTAVIGFSLQKNININYIAAINNGLVNKIFHYNYTWTQYNKRQHTGGRVSVQFIKLVSESTTVRNKTNANIHSTTKAHTHRDTLTETDRK